MSKVVKVTDGNYRITVDNGAAGTITLDTTSGASAVRGTVVVNGDLTVNGTTSTVESTVTVIKDNIITLNNGETGAGVDAANGYIAGIEIDRGSLPTARLVFNDNAQYFTGGSSGTGSFRLEDNTGAIMPLVTNSINGESTLYITQPSNSDPIVKNNDSLTNAKSVVDYVSYSLANNLQPGILDGDTSVSTLDFDTTSLESTIEFKVDNTLIGNFYSNRIEVADLKIQNNEISSVISNGDLLLNAPGTGSVTVKDTMVITGSPWDSDPGNGFSTPSSGIKLYARNTADTEGNIGLYYVNSNNVTDELISKNRALLFGMLF